jgi:hypothetical protein
MAWVRALLCKLQKGCTRLAATSDKVYQLFAQGRWFSPGTPASSTTKTGRHEILLKVALNTKKSINQSVAILALIKILQKPLFFVPWKSHLMVLKRFEFHTPTYHPIRMLFILDTVF